MKYNLTLPKDDIIILLWCSGKKRDKAFQKLSCFKEIALNLFLSFKIFINLKEGILCYTQDINISTYFEIIYSLLEY